MDTGLGAGPGTQCFHCHGNLLLFEYNALLSLSLDCSIRISLRFLERDGSGGQTNNVSSSSARSAANVTWLGLPRNCSENVGPSEKVSLHTNRLLSFRFHVLCNLLSEKHSSTFEKLLYHLHARSAHLVPSQVSHHTGQMLHFARPYAHGM